LFVAGCKYSPHPGFGPLDTGVLSAGENSDDVASGKAAWVTGRQEAAASCCGRSLAANMDYYNIRVNVALRLGEQRSLNGRGEQISSERSVVVFP
jgi:hypothetical protein